MWYWLVPVIVVVGVVVFAIVHRFRQDEELEPGGSYGEQFGGKESNKQN